MNYKLYWELTNEGDARLLRAFGEMPEPRFPAEIEGRAITEIGDYCFAAQAHWIEKSFPDGRAVESPRAARSATPVAQCDP